MLKTGMAPWPEADWKPVAPFPFAAARGAFAGMTSTEGRIVLRYFLRPDGALVATAKFGAFSEGAPGLVHGGAILTALDEALGAAAWLAGRPSLTARLTTEFRKPAPLGAEFLAVTRISRMRGRVTDLTGELLGPDGALYAAAAGRFLQLDEARQRRILGRAAPPKPPGKS